MSDIGDLASALEGRYRITAQIGEGGMATVYRADDLRHDRKVALKVLKPDLAAAVGADRFLAEIRTTANLQHPHILPLFDSGEVDGKLFFVMPLVDGETLRSRLDREKQLPVDEAVRIAAAVASALQSAHEQGVIHRDIKPSNILLTRGEPLVADFGIALAVDAAGGDRLTETGTNLGTPFYMSPEQATGEANLGPAADVYSLGCVLYEMLTGEPPFTGPTARSVLGKIIVGDHVPVTAHRRAVPRHVADAVACSLERIPADRFRSAAEFARALSNSGFRHTAGDPDRASGGARLWKAAALGLAAVTVLLAAVLVWQWDRGPSVLTPARFEVPFEVGPRPWIADEEHLTISPDGASLIYEAEGRLWLRDLGESEPAAIAGTEGARWPHVSPDGEELAFVQGGTVRVTPLGGGGAVRTLLTGDRPRWGGDGHIYAATGEGLVRVPQAGGSAEVVVPSEGLRVNMVQLLPSAALVGNTNVLEAVDLETGEVVELLSAADSPGPVGPLGKAQALPDGRLVYLEGGVLRVDRFDPEGLRLGGRPVSVLDGVANFHVSDHGRLVYTREDRTFLGQLLWVSRTGQTEPAGPGQTRRFLPFANQGIRLSRDDRRIVTQMETDGNVDIWIQELATGELTRLTYDRAREIMPRWGPGDATVTFLSQAEPGTVRSLSLRSIRSDGVGGPHLLFEGLSVATGFWSPDGEWLVVRTAGFEPGAEADILALRPGIDSVPIPQAASADADEIAPELSPDGRWLAYTSNETGRDQVWVQPFPEAEGARWQVSTGGGIAPLWSRSGRELFYVNPETREFFSARVATDGASFRVTARDVLFIMSPDLVIDRLGLASVADFYDVSSDDRRFLMPRAPQQTGSTVSVLVIEGWLDELRRLEWSSG